MSIFKFCFHNIFSHSTWFQPRERNAYNGQPRATRAIPQCVPVIETTGYIYNEKKIKSAQSAKSASEKNLKIKLREFNRNHITII